MRTSWNVGLATAADEPVPRAIPRTNVVFPAPSSPFKRTRSPLRRRRPSSSPMASVSSGAEVSRKVVVAGGIELHRRAVGAKHLDGRVVGEIPERPQACAAENIFRADADKLCLLAAGQRLLERRCFRDRNLGGADDATRAGKGDELVHLAQEAVGDVAAAESGSIQPSTFFEQRLQAKRAALAKGDGGGAKRAGDRDRPARLRVAPGQRSGISSSNDRDRQHPR